jgi:hypothetical protein
MKQKTIVFYYPCKGIGGAQLLFIRLAEYISLKEQFIVYYVDFEDGFSKKFLNKSTVKYIHYSENKKVRLPEHSTVIIPSNFLFFIDLRFNVDQNVLFFFWTIHPDNIKSFLINFKNRTLLSKQNKNRIGQLLVSLYEMKLIHFMDYTNYISNAVFFNFQISEIKYLQIPIGTNYINEYKKKDNKFGDNIKLAWLGRLDRDKINSVIVILNEIESSIFKNKITFYIIGDGSELNTLAALISNYNFRIILVGRLFGEELDKFITKNIDIGIAMGTSALEISKRAVPVILIDVYDKIFNSNYLKYDLFHQIKDYSLGKIYSSTQKEHRKYHFDEVLSLIIENYDYHAQKSLQYVKENHSIEIVGIKLLTILTSLTCADIINQKNILNELKRIKSANENYWLVKIINCLRILKNKANEFTKISFFKNFKKI